ncbi:MAG TPA: FAD-dependent oxidoreductase [Blastocatellia bacterium]|nr:FAD-dependent oxidoreductase [Blastocatellia bacterium]
MNPAIDRRQFLKQSIFALGALRPSKLDMTFAPKKIIIIGAGLAGLSAGYELGKLGHDITVLEARPYAGGRVFTIREPFTDGLYAEAGAQFIPESHQLTMRYVSEFGLPLVPVEPSRKPSIYHIRGRRLVVGEDSKIDWPVALAEEEKPLSLPALLARYTDPVLKQIDNAADSGWPPEHLKRYEMISMTEFLRGQGASEGAIELFRSGYLEINGEGIDSYSALSGLRDLALGHAEKEYRIRGGSDLLPKAFASRLAGKVIYDSPVVRIDHSAESVRVSFNRSGAGQTLAADHLICAIPFSILKRIEVSPRFSADKQKAVERLAYTSVTRVYLQMKRKFWEDEAVSGEVCIDNPRMDLFPLGHAGPRDVYESFMTGEQARRVRAMSASRRVDYVLDQAQKMMPAARRNFEVGASKSWDEDRWAQGAWAWYRPGDMLSLLPKGARPEGRIHFAGEHTSAYPGWMQGAFESAHRVLKEVVGHQTAVLT